MVRILHELNLEPATPTEARGAARTAPAGHRLMSLRYALLGFLTTEDASGYRLAQEFGESVGWFWHASHSQIHPELQADGGRGAGHQRAPG